MSFGRMPLGLPSSRRATRISRAVRSRFDGSRSSSASSSTAARIGPRPLRGESTGAPRTDGPSPPDRTEPTIQSPNRPACAGCGLGSHARASSMQRQGESKDGSIEASLKATYRALLARGLETGEAANLTAFLHGLPSDGFHWTLPEVEAVLHRRIERAADLR